MKSEDREHDAINISNTDTLIGDPSSTNTDWHSLSLLLAILAVSLYLIQLLL